MIARRLAAALALALVGLGGSALADDPPKHDREALLELLAAAESGDLARVARSLEPLKPQAKEVEASLHEELLSPLLSAIQAGSAPEVRKATVRLALADLRAQLKTVPHASNAIDARARSSAAYDEYLAIAPRLPAELKEEDERLRRLFLSLNRAVAVLLFQEGDISSLSRPVGTLDGALTELEGRLR